MQYAVQRWPMAVYDGTNSEQVMAILTDYRLVNETDGVLTLGWATGGEDTWTMQTGQVACMAGFWAAEVFDQVFHVLPEEPMP